MTNVAWSVKRAAYNGGDRQTLRFQALHRFSWPVVQDPLHFYKFRDKAKDESEEARAKAQMGQQQLPQNEGAAAGL